MWFDRRTSMIPNETVNLSAKNNLEDYGIRDIPKDNKTTFSICNWLKNIFRLREKDNRLESKWWD